MWRRRKKYNAIEFDDVLLDATNLPRFQDHAEGKIVKPIEKWGIFFLSVIFVLVLLIFTYRAIDLQIVRNKEFVALANANRIDKTIVFAERGVIMDRYKRRLAWNAPQYSTVSTTTFDTYAKRVYIDSEAFSHILGYVSYPAKDKNGNWWRKNYEGKSGIEKSFNDTLSGINGVRLIEVDALGRQKQSNTIKPPTSGSNLILSIDADLQNGLFDAIKKSTLTRGYKGGAGAIIDVQTGEILAMVSFPSYNPSVMSEAQDTELIKKYLTSKNAPLLNRVVSAVYAPGSIVKPYVALAALAEEIISPYKNILSTGALIVPNPYNPDKPSRFLDWKAHGYVDMRKAIAVSSNVYFYAIGGGLTKAMGLGVQEGLGIEKLAKYARAFGFGEKTEIALPGELSGNVPTPEWKQKVFKSKWLLGNTYHSAIGQYGWLVTPIQALRYVAAIANDGKLFTPPTLVKNERAKFKRIKIAKDKFKVVKEGMRMATEEGTLKILNYDDMKIAAKTGTAQVGAKNEFKNSWVIGFWPFDKHSDSLSPKFAFVIVLERAPSSVSYGAIDASRRFFNWLRENKPSYAKGEYPDETRK